MHISEIRAARPLQDVAGDRRHVADLGGGARKDRFREHRVAITHDWMPRQLTVGDSRADSDRVIRHVDPGQPEGPDIDNGIWRKYVDLHQIDKRRPTRKKHRVRAGGHRARRICRASDSFKPEAFMPRRFIQHLPHSGDDVRVGGTAAQIAAHPLADFLVCQRRGVDRLSNVSRDVTGQPRVHLPNGADGREDLSRRAVAALKAIAVQEGGLHRVKLVACGEAFNRDDVLALAGRRERQTRQDTLAVDDDRAGAARTLIAALLRPGQAEYVAERVEQRQA